MNGGKGFFDTSVLLYSQDDRDLRKQERALQLFEQYLFEGKLVPSTQVIQEFYAAASRKLRLPRQVIRERTFALLDLPLIRVEAAHIRKALENEEAYRISCWDALILATAEDAKAEVLFTEDLNHGQLYGAVRVENPFLGH